MKQAARDMKVTFGMTYVGDDADGTDVYGKMAQEIDEASKNSAVRALIVSIPEDDGNTVANAVQAASQAGTPIFGLERGYEVAQSLGLKSFIGMDDGLAGRDAALYFNSKLSQTVSKALFVRLDDTVNAPVYTKRLEGFRSGLALLNFTKQATVEEVVLSASTPIDSTSLNNALDGCSFELVLVGSASEKLVEKTSLAVKQKGCDASTLVGTFGTSVPIHKSVSAGKLAFAIHQQAYLQGAMSVVHAALYVTTGKHLAPSSESPYGMLRSGPELVTQDTALTDTFQICEADGFPVCPHNKGLDGVTESQCACTERPKMKIAGVLHAVTTDAFWDIVYTAANQAADDFDVELELDRMEPDEADVLHFKMATQIEKLCQEGVDGIFVTIPSDAVLDAIKLCQQLNVPVVSINAGPDMSRDLGLQHHLGMVEFNAGYLAGLRMIETGKVDKAVCFDHAPGNVVLIDRCGGFQKAAEEKGIPYLGPVTVPDDNAELFVNNVETFIRDSNNNEWSGLGILLAGQPQHEPGLTLKDGHPEILVAAFDTSDALYQGLEDGKALFGMDQGPYLQGYLPIPLLTWQAKQRQSFD